VTDVIADGVHPAADEAARWRAAARLRREHPRWVVIWLASAAAYRAYPLFRAPRETAVTAATPEQLAAEMDQLQQAAGVPRARSGATP
jgi:hypothetical protein